MKQKFDIIKSTCVPLPLENVDTDQIIPARFLKATTREEKFFGDNLFRYGFRVVISSFFADIHKNNELNNFVLPVVVSEEFLSELFQSIEKDAKTEVEVDLPNQKVTNMSTSEHFDINGYKKHCLMNGLDDIDYLLENKNKIEKWEEENK